VPLIDYACVVGLVADISKISRADVELAAALAADVGKISRPSVALASAEFLWLPQRWQLRWQNAASAEFIGLRLFLEGFFLQSRDGLGWA
jgi:hypothetical protein